MEGARGLSTVFVRPMAKTYGDAAAKAPETRPAAGPARVVATHRVTPASATAHRAEKARAAIWKYTQTVLPALDAIRRKSTSQKLDKLDHLVLKMEWEASRLG